MNCWSLLLRTTTPSTKRRKKNKRRNESEDRGGFGEYGSRKSDVRAWADADGRSSKDCYFDSNGDRDNLAFGSLYRMDVARYRPLNRGARHGLSFNGFSSWSKSSSALDRDADADLLDSKVKSGLPQTVQVGWRECLI